MNLNGYIPAWMKEGIFDSKSVLYRIWFYEGEGFMMSRHVYSLRAGAVLAKESATVNNLPLADFQSNHIAHLLQ